MTHSAVIELESIRFSWQKQKDAPTLAITHWQLNRGERVFLQGQSGSGKSTLLNLLSGILLPNQGSIRVLDTDITQLSGRQRDKFRAQNLGVIFQQFNLLPYLSVEENIRLSQTFSGVKYDSKRIRELCEQLKLSTALLNKTAQELSVGQQQRVAVARALYHKPSIIIADEPTSALDSNTRDGFIQLLLEQCQQTNSAVIFVSHDNSLSSHFDRVDDLHSLNQLNAEERKHAH